MFCDQCGLKNGTIYLSKNGYWLCVECIKDNHKEFNAMGGNIAYNDFINKYMYNIPTKIKKGLRVNEQPPKEKL